MSHFSLSSSAWYNMPCRRVDILIGQHNPAILQPLDVRTGKHTEPFAVRGVLGWTLNGPVHSQRPGKCVMNNLVLQYRLRGVWTPYIRWNTSMMI